jgi:hypothetical protein
MMQTQRASRVTPLPALLFLSSLCPLCLCGESRAALDPEVGKPYRLQVVLHLARHRMLTPVFGDRLERELRDSLQAAFGELAKVEVLRDHPLLARIQAQGLQQALDGWDEVSDAKTHFVLIDFADGRYEIQARQHDGLSGLNSPVVRRDSVPAGDRPLVARAAALLVDRDFGLAGTVIHVDDHKVEVALKGGRLGVPLGRWVKKGEVFAVSRVGRREGSRQRASRLDWTLLRVNDLPGPDGVCRCTFFRRYTQDRLTGDPGAAGFRCLKLATVEAPLRLRLVDLKTHLPLNDVQVHVSRTGFEGAPHKMTPDRGVVKTEESYAHVAFVKVLVGLDEQAHFPVEILGDGTVECAVGVRPGAEVLGSMELRRERWLRRIYDSLRVSADRVAEINAQLAKSREEALANAREGVQSLKDDVASLSEERDQLRKAAAKLPPGRLDIGEGEQYLRELERRGADLDRFAKRLEENIKDEKDPKKQELKTMLERARLLEGEAEYDQAIDLYEKVLEASPNEPKVKQYVEGLKKAWAVRSPEHREARRFIYEDWSKKLDPAELSRLLDKARAAFTECRQANDPRSLLKLLRADVVHAATLNERLEVLRRQASEDNKNEAKTIGDVVEVLKQLHQEVGVYVRQEMPSK